MKIKFFFRIIKETLSKNIFLIISISASLLIFIMLTGLFIKSESLLFSKGLKELFLSSKWKPMQGQFGFLPFIISTFYVTAISAIIAVPLSLLSAIYLAEYAGKKVQQTAGTMIDILAGIPSVIYGIWGVLVVVPLIKNHLAPFFKINVTGYSILAGGIVLAIMIFPVIIQISYEVIKSVPKEIREVSFALGATKWETIKLVVLKKGFPGISAAVILGVGRAFGETMAVLMVVGNVVRIPKSVFDPGYTLTALIANNYGEMLSIKFYDSALMFASLLLLLVILLFNILSKILLNKAGRY